MLHGKTDVVGAADRIDNLKAPSDQIGARQKEIHRCPETQMAYRV
jgi:hypothetical protein